MKTLFAHILRIKAAMILHSINQIRIWNMKEKLNKNTPVSQIFQLQNYLKFSATKKHFTLTQEGHWRACRAFLRWAWTENIYQLEV